jgi:hypothetical protein
MTNMKKWKTTRWCGYSYSVGDNPAASGGIQGVEVREFRGKFVAREYMTNGKHESYGAVRAATEAEIIARQNIA